MMNNNDEQRTTIYTRSQETETDGQEERLNNGKSESNIALERHLNKLFDEEVRYNCSRIKTNFIQNAIERIIGSLVDVICSGYKQRFYNIVANIRDKIVEDIYTTTNERFRRVGSFYEGTKLYFPNEFDYIVIFFSTRHPGISQFFNPCDLRFFFEGLEKVSKTLAVTNNTTLREVRFKKFVEYRGPAAKLQFTFGNVTDRNSFRDIYVDLTLAIKIIDCDLNVIKNYLFFGVKEFREEVLGTGSYLLLHTGKISFTETEMKFLKHTLSEKHVKVYRILKYLINGHGQDEILLHEVMETDVNLRCSISSYALKNTIICHHYSCSRNENDIAQCTLEALKAVSYCFEEELSAGVPENEPSTVSLITIAYYDHLLVHYETWFVRNIANILNYLIDNLEEFYDGCNKDVRPWAQMVYFHLNATRIGRRRNILGVYQEI